MKVVIDIETNSLVSPSQIWVIVCKDLDSGLLSIFRKVTDDEEEKQRFLAYAQRVSHWIGHNWLEYDYPQLNRLLELVIPDVVLHSTDTLTASKLADFSRSRPVTTRSSAGETEGNKSSVSGRALATLATLQSYSSGVLLQPEPDTRLVRKVGHSIEAYGEEFGYSKLDNKGQGFFSKWSQELEDYCVRDVEICERIYRKYLRTIHRPSLELEQHFQLVINALHNNGFSFNRDKATSLLHRVRDDLAEIDLQMEAAFPPQEVLIREFTPKLTKFGTISRTSVPRSLWANIHQYTVGKPERYTRLEPFNASSHKQVIEVLNDAHWNPSDKTQGHIDCERELSRLKFRGSKTAEESQRLLELTAKIDKHRRTGWKINEINLATLPPSAPAPARLLAKRILLESRRRTLTEWLGLVQEDGRIHGKFYGIGTWTHRMAHQQPNTANISNEFNGVGKPVYLGKEMRALWRAPKDRLLVGVDAEGIQLRIFAHYINDPEFTKALVEGRKDDKTDPHSLNQRILGSVCKNRQTAKRFIYALLLGAGLQKMAQILECSEAQAQAALDNLLQRYVGFAQLKKEVIPKDAQRGYFIGLDGRHVAIPGDTVSQRKHLAMSGYLQNGEAVAMKLATVRFHHELQRHQALLVNFVHDEWQTEVPNNMEIALEVARLQAGALRQAGEELGMKCPLAGSYWNEDHKDYTVGTNWASTH